MGKKYLEDYKYLVDCVKETGATPCFWNSPFLHYEEAYDYLDTDCVIYSEMYYTYKKEDWTKISEQDQWVKDYYRGPFKKREFYADYVAEYGEMPLGEFVRELVGMDMNAAKEAFAEFLNDTSLDSRQIYFVNQIVEYIVHNGVLKDLSVLQETPFTDKGSVVEVFTDLSVWMKIRNAIEKVNANAVA